MPRTYDRLARPASGRAVQGAGVIGPENTGASELAARIMQADFAGVTDQEVVQRARGGQESAYRELLHRYQRPVFSLIYRMVRDRELAEDLAQETFVKVLNALDSYRPEHKFSSWIFKIAINAAIDHLRRREPDLLSLDGAPDAVSAERQEATALQVRAAGESP